MKKFSALIATGLLMVVLFQAAGLFGEYGANMVAIRSNLGKSGQWRGVNFNQSQKVADYIEFLNRNIPETARVILPSFGGDSKLFINPYMQFFLAPRKVVNCNNIECLQIISREETYIVVLGNLPVDLFQDASFMMFDKYWGIIPPVGIETVSISEIVSFDSFGTLISAAVAPLLWIGLLVLTGTLCVKLLLPGQDWILQIALGYGLGLGMLSTVIAFLNLFGVQINAGLILIVSGFLLVLPMGILIWKKIKFVSVYSKPKLRAPKKKIDLWPILFVGLGGIVMVLGVGKGYHRIDAIQIWGAKGYGIASTGSLATVTDWGTNTLPYPLHIPVLIAAFRVLFGDILPSSKLVFGGYYMATMILGYFALLRMGVRRWLSCLSVLVIITTPIFFRHGTIGYANIPLTYYLLAGVLLFLPLFVSKPSRRNLLLSGLFFACAAWTRPEGWMLAIIGAGMLLFLVFLDKNISLDWGKIFWFIAPLFFYFIFWQGIEGKFYPEPLSKSSLTSQALGQIMEGEFHIKEFLFILIFLLKELVSTKFWGAFGIVLLLACIIVSIYHKFVSRITYAMIVTGGLFISMIIGMYFLTSFDVDRDLRWWLTSGFNRMIFPGVIILWLGIISAINEIIEGSNEKKKMYKGN